MACNLCLKLPASTIDTILTLRVISTVYPVTSHQPTEYATEQIVILLSKMAPLNNFSFTLYEYNIKQLSHKQVYIE